MPKSQTRSNPMALGLCVKAAHDTAPDQNHLRAQARVTQHDGHRLGSWVTSAYPV